MRFIFAEALEDGISVNQIEVWTRNFAFAGVDGEACDVMSVDDPSNIVCNDCDRTLYVDIVNVGEC